jgi:hypothetical protein
MSRPPQSSLNGAASLGTRDALLEALVESLGLAALQCELAQTYADAGDGVGLGYAMRKFGAYAKAALGTYDDFITWQSQTKESGRDARLS